MTDFEPHRPSHNGPAAFLATPIFDRHTRLGIFIFHIPIDRIDQALTEQAQADESMLVLADINMPVMGGLDMVRSIRGESRNLKTPILVLSTEYTKDVMRRGRDAGADGWMVKPFMPERLLAVVGKLTSSS